MPGRTVYVHRVLAPQLRVDEPNNAAVKLRNTVDAERGR
jgi:hypothetical protein